jgi:two-component system, NarL family, invasion response regulator UvrY
MSLLRARVLVVDDHAAFRKAARAVILAAGLELAGEAATGEEAVAAAESLRPDLVLMDVNMPGIGGIEATRQIARAHPWQAVALISSHAPETLPTAARSCGAVAWIDKEDFSASAVAELARRAASRSD